jgi:hypothetical protein
LTVKSFNLVLVKKAVQILAVGGAKNGGNELENKSYPNFNLF